MQSDGLPGVTDVDVRSLAAKLKGLHALLTPAEQALFQLVLQRAAECAEAQPDRASYAWAVSFNPFPYLDALVMGGSLANATLRGPEAAP